MAPSDNNVITLADGTQISTRTGRPVKDAAPPGFVRVPTHHEAQKQVTQVRRRVADLPEPPEKMNIISVVAAYHMFGLSSIDIALAIGATEQQVDNIKMLDAFDALITGMSDTLVEREQEDIRALIASHARNGVTRIASLMDSEDEKVSLSAARDIVDRAGHRPSDVIEHRHKMEGGLIIEYVTRDSTKRDGLPTIDMDADIIEDDDDG